MTEPSISVSIDHLGSNMEDGIQGKKDAKWRNQLANCREVHIRDVEV